MAPRALLRDADMGHWIAFDDPVEVLQADSPAAVAGILDAAAARARATGHYAVGFVSYEAAAGLDRLPTHPPGLLPPAWFGLFAQRRPVAEPRSPIPLPELDWLPSLDADGYRRALEQIRRYIAAGDTYQVNFSYRLRTGLPPGDKVAEALFAAMVARQPGGYGALLETNHWAVCSASHELFFSRRGRRLTSRPMKGTAQRGANPQEDAVRARWLESSLKNRAENLMITDMVRNDIGRLADVGSVHARELFRLEAYPTVWQMTSTVSGDTDASLGDVFRALFPAASITGAPKRRTMEIIRELEDSPREIYTGSLGLIRPSGDAQFNVAIRTALVDKTRGCAEYGVGGGILWDSRAEEELAETRTKSRILGAPVAPGLPAEAALLETLLWEPGAGYFLLQEHLARLGRAADVFAVPLCMPDITTRLNELARGFRRRPQRLRLLVDPSGGLRVSAEPLMSHTAPRRLALVRASQPLRHNPFVSHKTTCRGVYEQALRDAADNAPDADDVLLVNERGEVTESTIANLVCDLDGRLVTPPEDSGLLPGVYRQHLLSSGQLQEAVLRPADLLRARAVYLINSVRGLWTVSVINADTWDR